jgi:hypothetical protein
MPKLHTAAMSLGRGGGLRLAPPAAAAPVSGSVTKFVGAGSNVAGAGNKEWANASNVTADDGASASLSSTTMGEEDATQYLVCTMAGNAFAVPANATIDGVEVTVERRDALDSEALRDEEVSLVVGGAVAGNNLAEAFERWPSAFTVQTYGGPAELWGLVLTPDDVNPSDFGVALRAFCVGGTAEPRVDYVSITVYYTA